MCTILLKPAHTVYVTQYVLYTTRVVSGNGTLLLRSIHGLRTDNSLLNDPFIHGIKIIPVHE